MFQPLERFSVENLTAKVNGLLGEKKPTVSVFINPYSLDLQGARKVGELIEKKTAYFWLLETSEQIGLAESSVVTVKGRATESVEDINNQISSLPERILSIETLESVSSPRLRFGLSCAIIDLAAKHEGLDALNFLAQELNITNFYSRTVKVRGVLFQNEEERLEELKKYYRHFKLKLGPSEEEIQLVRKMIFSNRHCIFSVDCNGSFEDCPEKLLDFERSLLEEELALEYIEQPFSSCDRLINLRNDFQSPFALDQSLRTQEDLNFWSQYRDFIWVLKVSVLGSVFEVFKTIELAKATGNKFLVGGMLETVVGKLWQLYICCLFNPDFPSEVSVPNRYFIDEDLALRPQFFYPTAGVISVPEEATNFNLDLIRSFDKLFPRAAY